MRIAGLLVAATVALATPVAEPTEAPSNVNDTLAALESLGVSEEQNDWGFSNNEFKHWIKTKDKCSVRDEVLIKYGKNTKTNKDCHVESGTWVTAYDGGSWTMPRELDVDHLVPLKNAWMSGAKGWTKEQRQNFANDQTRPQLWVVTKASDKSKGDKTPDQWKPPLSTFHSKYAESWVTVKQYYNLTVTRNEKSALKYMLDPDN